MEFFQKVAEYLPRRPFYSIWVIWTMALMIFFQLAFSSSALADDPIVQVARVSLIEGEVNIQRANDSPDDWFDATANLPLNEGDQLYSGPDGRAEIQLSSRNIVRINYNTNLRFTQFNTDTIHLALPVGTATFRIDSLDKRQSQSGDANAGNSPVYFEIDTPTVAVVFLKEGLYRINVGEDGTTEVIARRGEAEIDNKQIDGVVIKEGRRVVVKGEGDYQNTPIGEKDSWDLWNEQRDDELSALANNNAAASHIPDDLPGGVDLNNDG
ncbi:MAG: FecR domain-containing protein, partial [Blastocatellia bacterium]|nr:FecR domain-containing protein [Blastocatellia bacterium]